MMSLSKRAKNILFATSLVLSSFACAVSSTLAWVVSSNNISMADTAGYTNGAYFARGKGTFDEPYILNAPIHLYNLSWLQYLGKFDDKVYYFEMESDIDSLGTEYEKIPPIGTEEHPFVGSFDGNGHTISGLKTCNKLGTGKDEILRKPSLVSEDEFSPNIMGVFGVIKNFDGEVPLGEDGSKVENFSIRNYTVVSSTKDVLVGAVAGYVDGNVSNIKVSSEGKGIVFDIGEESSSPTGYDSLSQYGLVGYTRNTTTFSEEGLTIYNPYVSEGDSSSGEEGSDTLWGASLTARNIQSRLEEIASDSSNIKELKWENRLKSRTGYYDSDGNILDGTETLAYYEDDELTLGVSEWGDTSLKGKAVIGGETLIGSIDRPAEKGWKDIRFTIGGGGGNDDGTGGEGGGEGGGINQDAIDPSDPYIAPTTKDNATYQYLVYSNKGNKRSISLTGNAKSATAFQRDESFYISTASDNNAIGVWHINNMSDGASLAFFTKGGGLTQIAQDRGRYLRMANSNDPSNGYPYYVRYNGSDLVITDDSRLANVVYIDGVLRVETSNMSNSRISPQTALYEGINYSYAPEQTKGFTSPILKAALVDYPYYYQSTDNPWNGAPKSVDNRAKGAVAGIDEDGFVYFDRSGQIFYPGYYNPPEEGEHTIANTSISFKFKETSDGALILYNGNSVYTNNQGKNGYLACNTTTFFTTYERDKANVSVVNERIRGMVKVDPSTLGSDAWIQRTSDKTHKEKLGETYLPLTIYESDDVPSDDVLFWSDNSVNPSKNYPTPNNSGYIVGGTKGYTYDEEQDEFSYESAYGFRNFDNSLLPFGGITNFPIVTRTSQTNGFGFVSNGGSASSLGSHIADSTVYDPNDLGFERFENSKTALSGESANFFRFNGMNISKDKYVTADSVLFNKHIYNDYELPEGSVDFQTQNSAIFNMFASSYADGELCTGFASFYQVFRGEVTRGEEGNETQVANGISEIRRISKIFKSETQEELIYVYFDIDGYFKYNPNSNGYTSISELEEGYSLAFDMEWIESPGFSNAHNACYYFEWPVSPGEYLLGSTPVGEETEINLGYICSVGLGAPAALTLGTQIFEKIVQIAKHYSVVEGIYFVNDLNVTPKAEDSLSFAINLGFFGKFSIEDGGDNTVILENYDSDSMELLYKKYDTIIKKRATDPPEEALEAKAISSSRKVVERLTNISTAANGNTISRVVTSTIIDENAPIIEGYSSLSPYTSHFDESTPLIQFYFIHGDDDEITLSIGIVPVSENDTYTVEKIEITLVSTEDLDVTFVRIDENTFDIYLNGRKIDTVQLP